MSAKRTRGSALLVVCALLLVFVGLAAAYLAIMSHNLASAVRANEAELAFTYAESGIDDAVNELNAQIDYGENGMGDVSSPIGRGSYAVELKPPFEGHARYVLRAVGECGDEERGIIAVVQPEGYSAERFEAALFGDMAVNIHQNASVDSWDSRQGDYSLKRTNRFRNQMYAGSKSHVKSNYKVQVGANAKVFGDVTTGPKGEAQLIANAHVAGVTTEAVSAEKMPAPAVPDIPSAGSRTVFAGRTMTVKAGEHHFEWVVLESGATLTIEGPCVVVFDHFVAGPKAKIEVDGRDGRVDIFGTGTFKLDPLAEWHSASKKAGDLSLTITTDTTVAGLIVEVDASGKFYGTVYAPNAQLTLDAGMELFGAVAARSVEVGPGFEVHYDEALAPPPTNPVYRLVSWEEEPVKKKKKK
jgi:hypothetical protein